MTNCIKTNKTAHRRIMKYYKKNIAFMLFYTKGELHSTAKGETEHIKAYRKLHLTRPAATLRDKSPPRHNSN